MLWTNLGLRLYRDWRKLDLSIDVILFAAPNAVHVNLYWSGNWAVLNGWACPSGIPRLWRESDKKLKTVSLQAFPVCSPVPPPTRALPSDEAHVFARVSRTTTESRR